MTSEINEGETSTLGTDCRCFSEWSTTRLLPYSRSIGAVTVVQPLVAKIDADRCDGGLGLLLTIAHWADRVSCRDGRLIRAGRVEEGRVVRLLPVPGETLRQQLLSIRRSSYRCEPRPGLQRGISLGAGTNWQGKKP